MYVNNNKITDLVFLNLFEDEIRKGKNSKINTFVKEIHIIEKFISLNSDYNWDNVFIFEGPDFLYSKNEEIIAIEVFWSADKGYFKLEDEFITKKLKCQNITPVLNIDLIDQIKKVFNKHFMKLETYLSKIKNKITECNNGLSRLSNKNIINFCL
ncbi:hypothetical protein [Spiroplasma sp. SV19]|uniref:hypothetical protein n=1 Tax=Spiroplasma sp. SV19 TaxID=2570468 RepID=UPI0024B6930A|nr:hypothetical protein [Spiroplasma sp. SV19]WHQ37059.1 hypothetical protein E7Y35_04075 [Spiroplasma sp. SV19]